MKEYNFRVYIEDRTELNTILHAKNEDEAWMFVKRQYSPAKGFKYELINVSNKSN